MKSEVTFSSKRLVLLMSIVCLSLTSLAFGWPINFSKVYVGFGAILIWMISTAFGPTYVYKINTTLKDITWRIIVIVAVIAVMLLPPLLL